MVNWFRGYIQQFIKKVTGQERGQSLVEMIFIVPILIFIFLGLIEVGWGTCVQLSAKRLGRRIENRVVGLLTG